jgi:hypothetical protein
MAALLALLSGCKLGRGDGWVRGKLWVEHCRDGQSFGTGAPEGDEFDLDAEFFAGQVDEDQNPSSPQRRHSLTLRVQPTSSHMEVSDGLYLQFINLPETARRFSKGLPVEITSKNLCPPNQKCTELEDSVRASLYLYTTCPYIRQPFIGASHIMNQAAAPPSSGQTMCLQNKTPEGNLPSPLYRPPCPHLTSLSQEGLDRLCSEDFNNKSLYDHIGQVLGGGACLYLCQFGAARRGQDVRELEDFHIRYGDHVTGFFSINLVDGRAVTHQDCAKISGEIRGMFSFEMVRGQSAQTFP